MKVTKSNSIIFGCNTNPRMDEFRRDHWILWSLGISLLKEHLPEHSTQDCVCVSLDISGEGDNVCVKIDITTWYCCIFCVFLIFGQFLKNKFIFNSEHSVLTSSSIIFYLLFCERSCQPHFIRLLVLFFHLYFIVVA